MVVAHRHLSATTLAADRSAPWRARLAAPTLGPWWVTLVSARAAGDRMRAVIYLAAHELRARWQGWAVLVVLVAVAGGAVLAAAAGALRTDSAYPRFLKAS